MTAMQLGSKALKAYRILVIRYRDGQLRGEIVLADSKKNAIAIASKLYGEVVGA